MEKDDGRFHSDLRCVDPGLDPIRKRWSRIDVFMRTDVDTVRIDSSTIVKLLGPDALKYHEMVIKRKNRDR